MRQTRLTPTFVDGMPEHLKPGTLYISVRFRTAAHQCACGCGDTVVTPIKPAKWEFTYDGDTVSMWPSIGRWQHPCRSHYVIRRNQILWHRDFDAEEADEVLRRDQRDLRRYYQERTTQVEVADPIGRAAPRNPGWVSRLLERAARTFAHGQRQRRRQSDQARDE